MDILHIHFGFHSFIDALWCYSDSCNNNNKHMYNEKGNLIIQDTQSHVQNRNNNCLKMELCNIIKRLVLCMINNVY